MMSHVIFPSIADLICDRSLIWFWSSLVPATKWNLDRFFHQFSHPKSARTLPFTCKMKFLVHFFPILGFWNFDIFFFDTKWILLKNRKRKHWSPAPGRSFAAIKSLGHRARMWARTTKKIFWTPKNTILDRRISKNEGFWLFFN